MNSVKVTLWVSNTLHLLPSPTWDPSSGPVMSRALISQKEMATGYCSGQNSSVCAQSSGVSSANTHGVICIHLGTSHMYADLVPKTRVALSGFCRVVTHKQGVK